MSKSVASEIEYFLFFNFFFKTSLTIRTDSWALLQLVKKRKKNLLGILDSQMLLVMILFLFVCLF